MEVKVKDPYAALRFREFNMFFVAAVYHGFCLVNAVYHHRMGSVQFD